MSNTIQTSQMADKLTSSMSAVPIRGLVDQCRSTRRAHARRSTRPPPRPSLPSRFRLAVGAVRGPRKHPYGPYLFHACRAANFAGQRA